VEEFEEGGVVAVGILDSGVTVVAHGHGEQDAHAGPLRSERQAVDEGVVGLTVRAHQELALGAATGDQVGPSGDDLAR
jgi:hypothetical protein